MDKHDRQHPVLNLIRSGQQDAIELAMIMANSQQIDIEAFLQECQLLLGGQPPSIRNLALLFSIEELDWSNHTRLWLPIVHGRYFDQPIRVLHPAIGWLQQLRALDLSNHNIEYLPPEIGLLHNLRRLRISNNQLRCLPPEIGLLTQLELLELSINELSEFPCEVAGLKGLHQLELHFNPIHKKELEKLHELLPHTRIEAKFRA